MNCPKCNAKIKKNSKFCGECGEDLSKMIFEKDEAFDDSRTSKNGKKKVLIMIGSSVLVLGIVFLIFFLNNFFCIFMHDGDTNVVNPTCEQQGYTEYSCKYCSYSSRRDETECLGHCIEQGECGKNAVCSVCGEEVDNHWERNYKCINCGKPSHNVDFPVVPLIVHSYNYNGQITESFIITEIKTADTFSGLDVYFTIERIYHKYGTNHSATPQIGYKLYSSDNQVIDSGNIYGDASIATGELVKGDIHIFVDEWKDYRLEILGIQD